MLAFPVCLYQALNFTGFTQNRYPTRGISGVGVGAVIKTGLDSWKKFFGRRFIFVFQSLDFN